MRGRQGAARNGPWPYERSGAACDAGYLPAVLVVDALQGDGHALAAGDAEGGQAAPGLLALELMDHGADDAGAGHADGVAEGDGAAVDVGPVPVELQLAVTGQDLGRERLVDLDHVDLGEGPAELGQQLLGGRD